MNGTEWSTSAIDSEKMSLAQGVLSDLDLMMDMMMARDATMDMDEVVICEEAMVDHNDMSASQGIHMCPAFGSGIDMMLFEFYMSRNIMSESDSDDQ